MKRAIVLAAACLLAPGVVFADPMDLQRCVWSCLSRFGPADNPAYHECVARYCADEAAEAGQQTPKAHYWEYGRRKDGRYYAGADTPDGNQGVYVFCTPSRGGELVIWGLNGPAARLSLVIGGHSYQGDFALDPGGWHKARIGLADPVVSALQSGDTVTVKNAGGQSLLRLGLSGSSNALSRVLRACR